MRFITTVSTLTVIAGTLAAAAVPAYAQSCHELWTERNSYYKARGYCFKTDRAINYFGNAGCRYHDEDRLPLTAGERRRIGEIRRLERAKGCD
jgi:YARHG domain